MELRGPRPTVKVPHERKFVRLLGQVHVTGDRRVPGDRRPLPNHGDLVIEDNLLEGMSIRRRSPHVDAGFMIIDPVTKTVTLHGTSTSLELPLPEWYEEARRITAERVKEIYPEYEVIRREPAKD